MPATIIEEPEVESPVEEEPARIDEPKPIRRKRSIRDVLVAIFEGHEEFLGWTPD
jgi:hypothetical protein